MKQAFMRSDSVALAHAAILATTPTPGATLAPAGTFELGPTRLLVPTASTTCRPGLSSKLLRLVSLPSIETMSVEKPDSDCDHVVFSVAVDDVPQESEIKAAVSAPETSVHIGQIRMGLFGHRRPCGSTNAATTVPDGTGRNNPRTGFRMGKQPSDRFRRGNNPRTGSG